ncbi:tripartite ATP-independent transporter DctM subunit [Tepidamorphus gemmatus]|jgi:tripartite ATP-independent transporter DctM subunit|uniref:TRAP transporter large permease protein n=1 Tax=Tepidamorphus gemmatus TaxID=747076 RepID=A0A4R3M902_9HYPH|nr:TRAP transporter large permease subunit [Tepidamorphus gemmatus]TCT10024.1 tripartite ATP-independent transporter DctM subunit [Tepidamorphus gemmatus]
MAMFVELLPLWMFVALAVLLFTGYPVAFILGGVGLAFALIGDLFGVFRLQQLALIPLRIYGGTMESPVLVAIPMFIFMGTMLEKSGVARDLLQALQVLLRRVPGGLALSVTLMGTIMAATTGIIGASVVMMTLLALPVMLERRYNMPLATGTIAASGTLGILIPPSIMLVIMADLLSVPVGTVFVGAIVPGLLLSLLYAGYIWTLCHLKPDLAPPLPDDIGPTTRGEFWAMILRSFVPPIALIVLVLGSIFAGFATPTEAAGVGAGGSVLLAAINRQLSWKVFVEVCQRSALTGGMLFGIFVGATAFSFVFRTLGGEHLIVDFIKATGVGPWSILLVLMLMIFLLGFFFDWIEITLIVLPVFAPIIGLLDFGDHVGTWEGVAKANIIWFLVLAAVNLQTSFLTPPFGFALFYMKGVAPPGVTIQQIYRGIIPFVTLQVVGLALCIAFPALVLWLPSMLLR